MRAYDQVGQKVQRILKFFNCSVLRTNERPRVAGRFVHRLNAKKAPEGAKGFTLTEGAG